MNPPDVVVLGDDRIMGDLILRNLHQRGYAARWVSAASLYPEHNDHELLKEARATIVDLNLPDSHIWDLARELRQISPNNALPLLIPIVTWPNQRRLAELAPCLWLPKPWSMPNLIKLLDGAIRGGSWSGRPDGEEHESMFTRVACANRRPCPLP